MKKKTMNTEPQNNTLEYTKTVAEMWQVGSTVPITG